jgi:hypothetical protein
MGTTVHIIVMNTVMMTKYAFLSRTVFLVLRSAHFLAFEDVTIIIETYLNP